MGDSRRPPGKSNGGPGISSGEVDQLRRRIEELEKLVREQLSERNQWNALVRGWIGTKVRIYLSTGFAVSGELLWTDRYTMCLKGDFIDENEELGDEMKTLVVHKGAIVFMHQEEQPASA